MHTVGRMMRFLNLQLLKLSWLALVIVLLLHFFLSWGLLALAGEHELVQPDVFYYFYLVTASTVGYGDFSPVTFTGRLLASILLVPGGVVLFAGFIGKLTSVVVNYWRKNVKGRADFSDQLKGHIVILGWHQERTRRMLELIFGDRKRQKRDVVLCASDDMENPMPGQVHFVRSESLTSEDCFTRSALRDADRVIIYGMNDDNTLTVSLAVTGYGTRAHVVSHFESREMANLLSVHAPQVETHANISIEMLVRSSQDPGSSRVQNQLLNTLSGPTQYSMTVPASFVVCRFSTLLQWFKQQHDALLFGVANSTTGDDLVLNPDADYPVTPGQILYFMAGQRLYSGEIDWNRIADSAAEIA